MERREIGILGEKLAAGFLKKQGYRIVETNYRCQYGEMDIIARHKECLVFIEVRTKTGPGFGTPGESITAAKMKKLRDVAAHYQQTHLNMPSEWRIDVVGVDLSRKDRTSHIEHIENAVGG